MGGHPDREVSGLSSQLHEIDGVGEFGLHQCRVVWNIAAERHDVLDSRVLVILQDVADFGPTMANADQVGHRGHLTFALDLGDEIEGPLA